MKSPKHFVEFSLEEFWDINQNRVKDRLSSKLISAKRRFGKFFFKYEWTVYDGKLPEIFGKTSANVSKTRDGSIVEPIFNEQSFLDVAVTD